MSILATTDGLTQTLTRRQLGLMADREFHRSQRQGRDLAVLLVDIDHFKGGNDT